MNAREQARFDMLKGVGTFGNKNMSAGTRKLQTSGTTRKKKVNRELCEVSILSMSEKDIKAKGLVASISVKFPNLFPEASKLDAATRKRVESELALYMEAHFMHLLFERVPGEWVDLDVQRARLGSLLLVIAVTAIPGKAVALLAFPAAALPVYKFIKDYKTLRENLMLFAQDIKSASGKLADIATYIYRLARKTK